MGKTGNIYTVLLLERLGSNVAFLLLMEIKLKQLLYSGITGYNTIPSALAIVKILGHYKLDSLEGKGTHIANISVRDSAFKETNNS